MKRITKFSVETERTYLFRSRDGVRIAWCPQCGEQAELTTAAGAADVSGVSEMAIYRLIESGALHVAEDTAGRLLVCLNSLKRCGHEG